MEPAFGGCRCNQTPVTPRAATFTSPTNYLARVRSIWFSLRLSFPTLSTGGTSRTLLVGCFAWPALRGWLDKRGTGMSDRGAELPGLDQRIDDLRAVMDAAAMDQAA